MIAFAMQLYRNAYRGLTHRIWLLGIVMLVNRSGTMVLAFLTLYSTYLGYTIRQAGFVVALYGIGSVAGGFLGGKISDKYGFYKTQFLALFCGGIFFIILGQMNTFNSICICTFFLSMVNESFRPANATAIAHYSTAENRTQSFSLIRLAINLGWGIGSALGGFLASVNYHLLFWVDGLTNIAAAGMLLVVLPKVSLSEQRATFHKDPEVNKAVSPFRDKTYLTFLGLIILFAFCFFQLFTTIPLFFKNGLHLNEFRIGAVMAGNGLLIAIFEMVIVYKLEGTRPYLALMCLGTLLMCLSYMLLHLPFYGIIVAVVFMLVITIAEMVGMPFMNSYYISRTNDMNRGQYAGLFTMSWSIAQIAGSVLGTLLADKLGFYPLWWVIAAVCLVTAIGLYKMFMVHDHLTS